MKTSAIQAKPTQSSGARHDPVTYLALRLREQGLGPAALTALELVKPLSALLSQLLVMSEPLLGQRLRGAAGSVERLLEDPDEMRRLADLLAGEAATTALTEEAPCQPSPS